MLLLQSSAHLLRKAGADWQGIGEEDPVPGFSRQGGIDFRKLSAANFRALINGRKKGRAAIAGASVVSGRIVTEKAREIGVLGAESVQSPGADDGADELKASAIKFGGGLRLVGQIIVDAVQHA